MGIQTRMIFFLYGFVTRWTLRINNVAVKNRWNGNLKPENCKDLRQSPLLENSFNLKPLELLGWYSLHVQIGPGWDGFSPSKNQLQHRELWPEKNESTDHRSLRNWSARKCFLEETELNFWSVSDATQSGKIFGFIDRRSERAKHRQVPNSNYLPMSNWADHLRSRSFKNVNTPYTEQGLQVRVSRFPIILVPKV